jgi:NAD(P)-dependent dehydrogenase (short-subunit alcohol dehydrogenase family)
MRHVVVTGANRGIGLEFVTQYLHNGDHVLATYRESSGGLEKLQHSFPEQLQVAQLDVTEREAASILLTCSPNGSIDLLIHNAGIYPDSGPEDSDAVDQWLQAFLVNTVSPIRLTYQLLPALRQGVKAGVAFLSSKMGSIADNTSGGSYLYRSSKAALNAAAKSLAIDLKEDGIPVVTLHPGWVKTDMGGRNALISPEVSVSGMRRVLHELTLTKSGQFVAYDGSSILW